MLKYYNEQVELSQRWQWQREQKQQREQHAVAVAAAVAAQAAAAGSQRLVWCGLGASPEDRKV